MFRQSPDHRQFAATELLAFTSAIRLECLFPAGFFQLAVLMPQIRLGRAGFSSGRHRVGVLVGRPFLVQPSSLTRGKRTQHFEANACRSGYWWPTPSITSVQALGQFATDAPSNAIGLLVSTPTGQRSTTCRTIRCAPRLRGKEVIFPSLARPIAPFLDAATSVAEPHAAGAVDAAGHHRLDDRPIYFSVTGALISS